MTVVSSTLSRWPVWTAYAAGAWSLVYGALGLYWALGGVGFPFGAENDPNAGVSVLAGLSAETGAPVIAVLGLMGVAVALLMTQTWGNGFARVVVLIFAWAGATALTVVIPDFRMLAVVGYAPLFLIGAPFGWSPGNFLDLIPWPVVNQFVLIGGGIVWTAAAIAYQRRSRNACGNCGRTDTTTGWTTPAVAARWGKWATSVAVLIPLLYAITRWAWALGIPLGLSEELLREGQATGHWWSGAGLATVAVGGALLTVGLIQRWGEIFPRWIPFLAGKRVPIWLVVVPASLVSVLVTTAGLMFVRQVVLGTTPFPLTESWAITGPELLWPIWGAALGAASLAYYYRRRGRCQHCGRGAGSGTESV